ncbi:hemagglutinin repeat-containing protein [uncultured Actinobacillus sp.]|uniref:hemagglutinin repeat-containing protein n=1 Tax=uncultured Actinobacillus sp. TaxID=417616 RepID=UPI0025E159A3|nr:hemagglutinin repeat-containing protein [uncultured Actinobacillus sp.]
MIKILQILTVNLPLVFDTSGVSLARPLIRIALNEQQEVRSIQPNLAILQNVWYRVNANPTNRVLVETDPAFTNQKRWLSSDYMYNALRHDHENVHKRLGDGYYEQRLVREQINRLTGRNFVGDYTDFDSQYRGLMDAGITFAQKFNLRPGVSLSPSQVASLTSDIVWLEEETVTLEDGSQQKVLVPKVYAVIKEGDLQANGALISAQNLDLKTQELINQGTIAGRDVALFNANRLSNSGNLSAKIFSANINGDMNNTGNITAENALLLNVTGNLTHQSTLRTDDVNLNGYAYKDTHLDRKGLLHVKGENGTLQIAAGNLTIAGADIINDGSGVTYLNAQNALNLTALSTAHSENLGSGDHYRHESQQGIEISRVQGKGDVVLSGQNIYSEAAQLEAKQRLALLAENDVVLGTASTLRDFEEYHKTKSGHKVTGKKTKISYTHASENIQQGSALAAENILVQSSQGNVTLEGSQLLAEKNIQVSGENVSITTAQNTYHRSDFEETQKSGFTASLTDTTASVGYEKSKIKNTTETTNTQVLSSALIALNGNVSLIAQDRLHLEAAQLSSGQDMSLQGKSVDILAATESADIHQESYAKSSGLGMKTLYNPFKEAKNNYKANAQKEISFKSWVNNSGQSGQASSNAIIRFTQGIATYAHSTKTQAKSHSHTETAVSSELRAGGNLTLLATDNDITTQGALLTAEGNATLLAKENIRLGVAIHTQAQSAAKKTQGLQWDGTQTIDNKVGVHHNRENGQNSLIQDQGTTLSIGGSTQLATQSGDIALKGTTLAGQGDVQINAARNLTISTANTLMSQSENSKLQSVGGIDISPTEKFYGYHRELRDFYGNQKTHQGSQVTSLEGNVTLTAGKDFHQTSSEILSTQNTSIQAQEVLIDAAQDTMSSREHNSDLKVGTFARVKSPLLDLLNLVDTAVNTADNASDRTKAANMLGLAAKGYTVGSTIYNATKGHIDGTLLRAEAGFGVAHSRSNNLIKEAQSQGNTINGKNVTIEATAGNLTAINTSITGNDKNAERLAGSKINLQAKNNLNLLAGESTQYQQGKQTNAGVEVGTAFSIGAKTGWSIYANVGYGNSKQKVDNLTHNNTYIDSETVNLQSGKETNLIGAGVTAKTINLHSGGNLYIESLQDREYQKQSSQSAGLQLELGLGSAWSFSLSGSSAKGTARRNQVNEQSGLYAEDGGYHINADNIHLKGGVIASTSAENSELSTNRFTFEDIQNDSHSQATSLSGSVGMSRSSDTLYDKNGKVISNPTRAQYADKTLKREKGETGLTGGIGIPLHESQSDSSLTKATLTEGKITLNKDSQPTQTTAKALGINTEIKNANEQVENTLNLDRTLQEQTAVQTAVANLQEAAKTYVDNKRQEAQAEFDKVKQQHNKDSETYKTAEAAVKAWEIGGKNKQNIDTVTAVVSTVLAGSPAEQIAVAALSPTLNNQIHALTKDDNSKVTNILAHAVLGAIEAKAAGVNGASGAVAAAGAEIIAHTLAEQLYGVDGKTKTIDGLTQEEKQNILTLSQLGSAIAGGMTADSGYAAGVSGEIGKRAVENNKVSQTQAGTIEGFVNSFNMTRTRMGLLTGKDAENALFRLNDLDLDLMPATTGPLNHLKDRYIYTENGGWIDMVHFLFYAGEAYSQKVQLKNKIEYYKSNPALTSPIYGYNPILNYLNADENEINIYAINNAIQKGYIQERFDSLIAKHSAYSYEDLPSDRFGAEFGVRYFNPSSMKTFGEQLKGYFVNELKATNPQIAPNYSQLPKNDDGTHSGIYNKTTQPIFINKGK